MYKDHKDIPLKYRRLILEEFLVKRVSKVPLHDCNGFIQELIRQEEENESLKHFVVEVIRDNSHETFEFKDSESAYVALDRAIGYDEHCTKMIAVMRQAGRIVRAYVNGKWIDGRESIYTV